MKVEDCLAELSNSDEASAEAITRVEGYKHALKIVKASEFLKATGTIAEREHKAYNSKAYRDAVDNLDNATADNELLKAKRKSWETRF